MHLVRHADAGDRLRWSGPDELRQLSGRGHRQAGELALSLVGEAVAEVLSSPAVRCRQTVEPLAAALGLEVRDDARLAEGAPLDPVLELIRAGSPVVLCSHGDVIGGVLGWLGPACGVEPERLRCSKGSTWVFDVRAGAVIAARYLPAPRV